MLTSSSTPFSLPDRVVQISLDEDRTPTSVDWDSLSNIAEYLLIAIFSCAHNSTNNTLLGEACGKILPYHSMRL